MGSYCFINTVSVLQDEMCSGVHGRDGRTKLDDWRVFPQANSSLVTVLSDFNVNATPFSALPSAGPECHSSLCCTLSGTPCLSYRVLLSSMAPTRLSTPGNGDHALLCPSEAQRLVQRRIR